MSDETLILDQFVRLLDGLDPGDPWPALEQSGFLDLLRPEADGGAELDLQAVFPLAIEVGGRPGLPAIIEAMAARLSTPDATAFDDVEAIIGRPLAAALAAAQMVGAMEAIERMTVDYCRQRQQFGREIGRFQAVQHHVAVLAEEVCAARIAVQAALTGAPGALSMQKAALAKIRAGIAADQVSGLAHAVHGAIGMSEEFSLHHLTRRLRTWQMAYGGEAWWSSQLGAWAVESSDDFTTLARRMTV